jgi:hypothetical protein
MIVYQNLTFKKFVRLSKMFIQFQLIIKVHLEKLQHYYSNNTINMYNKTTEKTQKKLMIPPSTLQPPPQQTPS